MQNNHYTSNIKSPITGHWPQFLIHNHLQLVHRCSECFHGRHHLAVVDECLNLTALSGGSLFLSPPKRRARAVFISASSFEVSISSSVCRCLHPLPGIPLHGCDGGSQLCGILDYCRYNRLAGHIITWFLASMLMALE